VKQANQQALRLLFDADYGGITFCRNIGKPIPDHTAYKEFDIAMGYVLDGGDSIPRQGHDFALLHSVQTAFGMQPDSYPMRTGGDFPWGKAAGA
jgi:hypothetical protein